MRLYDAVKLPSELLRDPTCWLEAQDVEDFLFVLEKEFCQKFSVQSFITEVGHRSLTLKAWGTLDSVLKMMQQPQDIFFQPQRFISYFVSPEPEVSELIQKGEGAEFTVSLSQSQFPHVVEYLRASLEALPSYMGRAFAHVTWVDREVKVTCQDKQQSLFTSKESSSPNIDPKFLNSMMAALEKAEREIEEKNKKLFERKQQIEDLQIELENLRSSQAAQINLNFYSEDKLVGKVFEAQRPLSHLQSQLLRLSDYLARAHQLVTMLSAKDRGQLNVEELKRRVDWQFVSNQYVEVLQEALDDVGEVGFHLRELTKPFHKNLFTKESLDDLISEALEQVRPYFPETTVIDTMLLYNRPIKMNKELVLNTLSGIFQQSAEALKSSEGKQLRVITRPKGIHAEIEISDTGTQLNLKKSPFLRNWSTARKQFKANKGRLEWNSSEAGTTYVIDLPV